MNDVKRFISLVEQMEFYSMADAERFAARINDHPFQSSVIDLAVLLLLCWPCFEEPEKEDVLKIAEKIAYSEKLYYYYIRVRARAKRKRHWRYSTYHVVVTTSQDS